MLVVCVRVSPADDRQPVKLQRDTPLGACMDACHLQHGKASGAYVPSAAQEPLWTLTDSG